jgi:hypothetical protein
VAGVTPSDGTGGPEPREGNHCVPSERPDGS